MHNAGYFAEEHQQMKIAFFHQPIGTISLRNRNAAIEIWTYETARRLAKHHDVIVYAKKPRHQKKTEFNQGVQYRRIPAFVDEGFYFLSRIMKLSWGFYKIKRPLFASSLYYLTHALRVAKDLKLQKCDIVHIHNFSQFVPLIRAFNPKIKIVLHMHCEWLTQLDPTMIKKRLKKTDLIIGCSEYITEKIRCRFPEFAQRCQTVFNGADVTVPVKENDHNMPRKNDAEQLLFVGRVSPEKGVHVLLDALQIVATRIPQTQLKIVGQPGASPQFTTAVSDDPKDSNLWPFYRGNYLLHLRSKLSPSLASHVSFAGSIPHDQLIHIYRDSDILILPSVIEEPFGMPIIEAMAAGLPVVATRSGGIPEIVLDGETGLLVERDNSSALAQAILRLLLDEDSRKSMGKAAHERAVELFSWEKTVENLLSQYKKLCEDN
jgi:glycosyltransferase involved in cell wall biosynthesis